MSYTSFWPGRVWFGRRFPTRLSYRRIGSHSRLRPVPSWLRKAHRGLVLASFDDRLLWIPIAVRFGEVRGGLGRLV